MSYPSWRSPWYTLGLQAHVFTSACGSTLALRYLCPALVLHHLGSTRLPQTSGCTLVSCCAGFAMDFRASACASTLHFIGSTGLFLSSGFTLVLTPSIVARPHLHFGPTSCWICLGLSGWWCRSGPSSLQFRWGLQLNQFHLNQSATSLSRSIRSSPWLFPLSAQPWCSPLKASQISCPSPSSKTFGQIFKPWWYTFWEDRLLLGLC